jgi:hypothetical protein
MERSIVVSWFVVDLMGVLSVESTEGGADPLGEVVAGPFDTEREAIGAYVSIRAASAQSAEIIGR